MKNFIERNSPIFVIGAFTLGILLIIVIASSFRKQKSPELVPLTNEQVQNVETSSPAETDMPSGYEVDKKYGTLEIKYTLQGFDPKDAKSIQNQLVRWTNTTEIPITINSIIKSYPELNDGIKIEPGKTFEFRLYKPKLWSYKEAKSEKMGTVFVVDN